MSDVLTEAEKALRGNLDERGGDGVGDCIVGRATLNGAVTIVDRLCARIEKLEAVAKAARGARLVLGTSPLDDSDGDIAYHGLRAALAALKESK